MSQSCYEANQYEINYTWNQVNQTILRAQNALHIQGKYLIAHCTNAIVFTAWNYSRLRDSVRRSNQHSKDVHQSNKLCTIRMQLLREQTLLRQVLNRPIASKIIIKEYRIVVQCYIAAIKELLNLDFNYDMCAIVMLFLGKTTTMHEYLQHANWSYSAIYLGVCQKIMLSLLNGWSHHVDFWYRNSINRELTRLVNAKEKILELSRDSQPVFIRNTKTFFVASDELDIGLIICKGPKPKQMTFRNFMPLNDLLIRIGQRTHFRTIKKRKYEEMFKEFDNLKIQRRPRMCNLMSDNQRRRRRLV